MTADISHPSFTQPCNLAVSVWRYMDLSKFAALLQRQCLYLARADKLGDPFEGSMPENNARLIENLLRDRRKDPTRDPFNGMDDAAVEHLASLRKTVRERMVKWHYVNCWHMNEDESVGMWKLYSKSSDAVCIKTTYEALATVLPSDHFMGTVKYLDFRKDSILEDNLFAPFLIKRRSFSHECEARIVVADYDFADGTKKEGPLFKETPVRINDLIKGIYVSPEAANWFCDVVGELAAKYGCNATVKHSEISSSPLY